MADTIDDDTLWTILSGAAALAAATGVKKALSSSWTKRRGSAPGNPAASDTTWGEAIAWALLSGVAVGLVRLVAQRGVAAAFEKRNGHLPSKARTEATA